MRRRTITRIATVTLSLGLGLGLVGCGEKEGAGTGAPSATPEQTAPTSTAAAATPTASAAPTVENVAATAAVASAAPTVDPAASAVPSTTATAAAAAPSSTAATAASAASGPKTFDCGAKGQKPCPMQGWMKSVMASASSSGDGAKLANALAYTAGKPPPGMGQWTSISNAGVAKAKAGDIEGAKATCKQCHDLYKEKYKASMRDRPW